MHLCCNKNDIDAAVVLVLIHVQTRTIASVTELQTKEKVCKTEGMKGLPSETMKEGETPEETTRRMMQEELGILWNGEVTILPDTLEGLPHDYTVHVAVVKIFGNEKPIVRPHDIREVDFNRWLTVTEFFALEKLVDGTRPETRPALDMFLDTT